ncbi:MAG: c-type cytochrome [Acidobacteria bacterium]|nr:c-type cytochrome [Acidobacteriota bacterium]
MFAAATPQQSVALVIFLLAAGGWIVWLLANIRRARPEIGAELELAPNRKPYYGDDELEGFRIERVQLLGLAFLVIIGLGLPLYWLAEPGRQAHAVVRFDETFANRGAALFAPTAQGGFNCAGCHGGGGVGGSAPYTLTNPVTGKPVRQVSWKAPSLNDVALRMTDDQLKEVLTYGRPFSPMPAWGVLGGGPMNDQQIQTLIAYLKSLAGVAPYGNGKAGIKTARAKAATDGATELKRLQTLDQQLATAKASVTSATTEADQTSAQQQVDALTAEIALKQDKTMGAALFNLNCSRCHTIGWSYDQPAAPGSGAFGPPLYNTLQQFPNETDHIDFVTNGKKFGEKYGRQGKASGRMPFFGQVLSADQIKAIVEYERSLSARVEQAQKG